MRDLGADVIVFVGAVVSIAIGSLVLATYQAIGDDMDICTGVRQPNTNPPPPSLIQTDQVKSIGNDLTNYVTYSYTGAIACIVVGSLQIVVLLFKYGISSYSAVGGRRR